MNPTQELLRTAYEVGFTFEDIVKAGSSQNLTAWCQREQLVSCQWLLSYFPEWLAKSEYLAKVDRLSAGGNIVLYTS